MAGYTSKVGRSANNELPIEVTRDVIQGVVEASAILSLAQRRVMPSHSMTMPALATFPEAYWLNGSTRSDEDTKPKQTTTMTWEGVNLNAAEIAVLVPIPDALVQDELFDIMAEVRPRLVEELGRKIDLAALYGDDKPTLWSGAAGAGIYDGAIAANNVVTPATVVDGDTSPDLAQQFGYAAQLLAEDGFDTNGFIVGPGLKWRLRNLRDTTGEPIYSDLAPGQPATLFGEPLISPRNGGFDTNRTTGILGDFNNAMIGIRQDVTFSISDSAVIRNPDTGLVTYSAFQDDGKVLRVVMRVAFAVANPINRLNTNASTRYPFAVVTPTGASSS